MIDRDELELVLKGHVGRQRWFAGSEHDLVGLGVVSERVLQPSWPGLVQVIVRAILGNGVEAVYQLLIGLRPVGGQSAWLEGKPDAFIGQLSTEKGPAIAYDAMADAELALALLHEILPDEVVERARSIGGEQSNSSIVYDERLILKLFRRLPDGPNPDAEVTKALMAQGYANVAPVVGEWKSNGNDLAVVSRFLQGATDGVALALTSLRDLYDTQCLPEDAGGNFAPEARRVGMMTAEMHLALAEAYGADPGRPGEWADAMDTQLERVSLPDIDADAVRAVYARLRATTGAGPSIRAHGDFHLGQVMRTDDGWYVLDFEGEPDRPLEERQATTSPMRDVAGMLRSFHYAAQVALRDWSTDPDENVIAAGDAWEKLNASAFLEGYLFTPDVAKLLPGDPADLELVSTAFELDKAVYEVGYELGRRPDWAFIPVSAVQRLLARISEEMLE